MEKELMVPKHRFDCVNLCLKETKQALGEKTQENDKLKARITEIETELVKCRKEKELAEQLIISINNYVRREP